MRKKEFLQFAYHMIEFSCFQFTVLIFIFVMAAGCCLLVVLLHLIIIEARILYKKDE